jgi:hypothetical protein
MMPQLLAQSIHALRGSEIVLDTVWCGFSHAEDYRNPRVG